MQLARSYMTSSWCAPQLHRLGLPTGDGLLNWERRETTAGLPSGEGNAHFLHRFGAQQQTVSRHCCLHVAQTLGF